MTHFIKRIAFALATGFTGGAVVLALYAVFEWAVGTPATPLHVAFGVGGMTALVAWNA